jgi:hypothetical protein
LACSTVYATGDTNAPLEGWSVIITNFIRATNRFTLAAIGVLVPTNSFFVVSNAGSAWFNYTYTNTATLGTNWTSLNGTNTIGVVGGVYYLFQPGSPGPTPYYYFTPAGTLTNGEVFSTSALSGSAPNPTVWYFCSGTNAPGALVLTAGSATSGSVISPALVAASISFLPPVFGLPPGWFQRTITNAGDSTFGVGAGVVCLDTNYLYVSVATNAWKRAALSSW